MKTEIERIEKIITEGIANGDHPKTITMKIVTPTHAEGPLRTLTPQGIKEWTKQSEKSLAADPRRIR